MVPSRVAAPVLAAFVPGLLAAQPLLRGRAYDTYTQAPLAGVTVTPQGGAPVVTDRDGRFGVPCDAPRSR